jgi:hypothetical protein
MVSEISKSARRTPGGLTDDQSLFVEVKSGTRRAALRGGTSYAHPTPEVARGIADVAVS